MMANKIGLDKVLDEIRKERQRQVVVEGYTRLRDDEYSYGELPRAAMAYCQSASTLMLDTSVLANKPPPYWPWDDEFWKPKTPRHDLVRAAALIVAEIERIGRRDDGDSERG